MANNKTKLHELLAVNGGLETQASKVRADLTKSFESKRHLFEEKRVTFTPSGEGSSVTESQSDIQTTVEKELQAIKPFLIKAIDSSYQIAEANTIARADIVTEDGVTLVTGVPATTLLELEKRVTELATLVAAAPTLDPAKGFRPDEARGKGYFVARSVKKKRTKKEKVVIVLHPPTVEHPAQTQLVDKDVEIGEIEEQEWSGLLTPAQKSDILNRIEILGRAVRKARSRANEVETDKDRKIGESLIGYVFGK